MKHSDTSKAQAKSIDTSTTSTYGAEKRRHRPITALDFPRMKAAGRKIAMLTAYDYYTAKYLDEAEIDGILVGDSANMVFYGEKSTLSITLDQMLYHTRAVSRAVRHALVVGDMPFMSYQVSSETALVNAGRFLKEGGAAGVKLEGGREIAPTIERLVGAGIPVMGHIGLVPQSAHRLGGFTVQGKNPESREYLIDSARVLEQAGCFSMVVELVRADVAEEISRAVSIPTIGIGAGIGCDGQILVTNDMLGLFDDFKPRFVRRYAQLGESMREAMRAYAADVRAGKYPSAEESY